MIPRLIAPPRFERPPDSSDLFTDDAGPRYKGDWHFVEVYLEMNSAGGGLLKQLPILKLRQLEAQLKVPLSKP